MAQTILVIDDEMHICALLSQILEELTDTGVELLIAQDGAEGLRLALAHRPALILLDVMLPTMDGYQVCGAIKQAPSCQDTHIILLTAKGQAIDKRRGEDVLADEYITKPFDPDLILLRASTILGIPLADGSPPF